MPNQLFINCGRVSQLTKQPFKKKKIVKESSACIDGYPRTLLDADHQAMCKFKDENDNNFKRVAGVLGRWAKELQAPPKKAKEQSVRILNIYIRIHVTEMHRILTLHLHRPLTPPTPRSPEATIRAFSWDKTRGISTASRLEAANDSNNGIGFG